MFHFPRVPLRIGNYASSSFESLARAERVSHLLIRKAALDVLTVEREIGKE